jgi:UTP--glucose-1-phosphate uridylyltransferase
MERMTAITVAVILAAGAGTRLLPATKAVPKEMLPVVDRPLIQYAVEEVVAAGVRRVVIVDAEGKEAIRAHFGRSERLEEVARARGDEVLFETITAPQRLAEFEFVLQDRPLGIADAVKCARHLLEGGPFALLFPDDIIIGEKPAIGQLADAYQRCQGTVLAVHRVARDEIRQYGIVHPEGAGNPVKLRAVVEKPDPADAPSDLGIVGRYILSPTIFEHIDRIRPGAGGELQITDAIASQIRAGEPVFAYQYEGTRYDTGRPAGMIIANVALGMRRPDVRDSLLEGIPPLLEQGG